VGEPYNPAATAALPTVAAKPEPARAIRRTMAARYRCGECGNLTRFDVVTTRRTSAFHHYSAGGDLAVEEEKVLEERVDRVTCRWCGASGDSIEASAADAPAPAEPA